MKKIHVVNNEVIVEDKETNNFEVVPYAYDIFAADVVFKTTGINMSSMHIPEEIKAAYSAAGDVLGTSVKNYIHMLKGAMHKAYIGHSIDLHNRFSWYSYRSFSKNPKIKLKWRRDPKMVNLVNKNISTIRQYIEDRNTHVAAFGMISGDAEASKKIFGKGLWKQLRINSKSRNDKICKIYLSGEQLTSPKNIKGIITMLNGIQSTLLTRLDQSLFCNVWGFQQSHGIENIIPKIVKHLSGPLCKIDLRQVDILINEIRDCVNMRENFNPNWSIKRIKREHAIGVKAIFDKKYGKDKFTLVEHYPSKIEDSGGEYKATLLDSPFKVALHGKDQHHCVGSYIDSIHREHYIVYKIEKGDVITTLGISLNPDRYNSSQHLGVCNATVDSEERLAFAESVKKSVLKIANSREEFIQNGFKMIGNALEGVPIPAAPAAQLGPVGIPINNNGVLPNNAVVEVGDRRAMDPFAGMEIAAYEQAARPVVNGPDIPF